MIGKGHELHQGKYSFKIISCNDPFHNTSQQDEKMDGLKLFLYAFLIRLSSKILTYMHKPKNINANFLTIVVSALLKTHCRLFFGLCSYFHPVTPWISLKRYLTRAERFNRTTTYLKILLEQLLNVILFIFHYILPSSHQF